MEPTGNQVGFPISSSLRRDLVSYRRSSRHRDPVSYRRSRDQNLVLQQLCCSVLGELNHLRARTGDLEQNVTLLTQSAASANAELAAARERVTTLEANLKTVSEELSAVSLEAAGAKTQSDNSKKDTEALKMSLERVSADLVVARNALKAAEKSLEKQLASTESIFADVDRKRQQEAAHKTYLYAFLRFLPGSVKDWHYQAAARLSQEERFPGEPPRQTVEERLDFIICKYQNWSIGRSINRILEPAVMQFIVDNLSATSEDLTRKFDAPGEYNLSDRVWEAYWANQDASDDIKLHDVELLKIALDKTIRTDRIQSEVRSWHESRTQAKYEQWEWSNNYP